MKYLIRTFSLILSTYILFSCGGGSSSDSSVSLWPGVRYSFDESTGTTAYNVNYNDLHGQIVGAQRVVGKSGNALDFSSVNGSHVLFDICCYADPNTGQGGKEISFPDDSFTIATWLKPTSMLNNTIYPVFGGWYGAVQSIKLRINDETLELLLYPENNGDPISLITSSSSLSNGVWAHVAITHDGSHSVIYINGIEDNSANIIMSVQNIINDYYIGGIPSEQSAEPGEHSFPGVIDDFFFSNNALSQVEVDALIAESN